MIIKNGLVLGRDFSFEKNDIRLSQGIITEIGPDLRPLDSEEVFDIKGKYVIPGLIDIHIHGAKGVDFSNSNPEGLEKMATYLASVGVTSFLPTSMTMPLEEIKSIYEMAGDFMAEEISSEKPISRLQGIYMEGPFFSFDKRGAQDENYLQKPDFEMFRKILETSGGRVKVVSLAPELEGAMNFIEETLKLGDQRPVIALGHTVANYDQAKEAFDKGASHVTHLYNGMLPFMHRAPGLLGAASENDRVSCELISDGVHIHEAAIRLTFKLLGKDRVILISDGLSPMGCVENSDPERGYLSGHKRIHLKDGAARLEDGTLAGSNTPLSVCLKKAVEFKIPLEWAAQAATLNPARVLGIDDKFGSIERGKIGDLLVLDKDLDPFMVFIGGHRVKTDL